MKTRRDDFVLLNNGTFTSMESFNVLDFIIKRWNDGPFPLIFLFFLEKIKIMRFRAQYPLFVNSCSQLTTLGLV
jgi:hypothetical protein